MDYISLEKRIVEAGLLKRRYGYYAYKILLNFVLLGLSISIFILVDSFWVQILNAAFMAFVFVQVAFIVHDSAHNQIFKSSFKNDIVGLLHAGPLLGIAYSWWYYKHNKHHSNPNELDADPDIDFPMVAFSEEQALSKKGIGRVIVKYQYILYPLLMTLVTFNMRFHSIRVLVQNKQVKYRFIEATLMGAHLIFYLSLLFYFLSVFQAIVFMLIHHALMGIYFSSVFAPNHKGMPILKKDSKLDFLQKQVITARNINGSRLADFWYGGLNYQIEHHLFTAMPRNKLGSAQEIIQNFCIKHNIPYHKTGVLQSWKEIFACLRKAGAVLRRPKMVVSKHTAAQ